MLKVVYCRNTKKLKSIVDYFENNDTEFELVKINENNVEEIFEGVKNALETDELPVERLFGKDFDKKEFNLPIELYFINNFKEAKYPLVYDDAEPAKGINIGSSKEEKNTMFLSKKCKRKSFDKILEKLEDLAFKEFEIMN